MKIHCALAHLQRMKRGRQDDSATSIKIIPLPSDEIIGELINEFGRLVSHFYCRPMGTRMITNSPAQLTIHTPPQIERHTATTMSGLALLTVSTTSLVRSL
jgi:hypothetical protein